MNDKALRSKLIRLAHARPELRAEILPLLTRQAGCEKLPEGGMRDNCEKKKEEGKEADKKASQGKSAHGAVALRDPDVMLYFIDQAANSSKFYEMKIVKMGMGFTLQKRWGRLTDSGATGRVDSKDESFPDLRSAQAAMITHKMDKTRKGYKDASSTKSYPIGLGGAGFGWGGQAACAYIPELKQIRDVANAAMRELAELGGAVSGLARRESSMAAKLNPLYSDAVSSAAALTKYLDGQLASCR
jgi:predicted DNA-binding WGR domain protein